MPGSACSQLGHGPLVRTAQLVKHMHDKLSGGTSGPCEGRPPLMGLPSSSPSEKDMK